MNMRILALAASAVVLLSGCNEDSKKQEEASICKGLNEADCTAKTECSWNADKSKCKARKEDRMAPEQSAPPAASEQMPPEQSVPPASEQPPSDQSAPPAQSAPEPSPSESPEGQPPQ
jgi:hypothetical protein